MPGELSYYYAYSAETHSERASSLDIKSRVMVLRSTVREISIESNG